MSEPVENLYSSSPLSEDEGFNVGRGSTSPEHTSLDRMTSPYYSYRVDKAIQKHDSHYWARHFSILPPRTESPANTSFETPPTLQSAKVPSRASTPIVEVENESLRELRTIYTNFQKCLDLRDKYMVLSLQRLGDNPKDADGWKIYPPPPQPTWPNHGLTNGGNNDNDDTMKDGKKEKKQVGEDFHFEECEIPGVDECLFELDATGVYRVYENEDDLHNNKPAYTVPSIKEYFVDLDFILDVISDGPAKSFAYRRLQILESKWSMHVLLHELEEIAETKVVPHRDFYNVRKVDTHVHLSSCMNSKHLLRFIKSKLKKYPKDEVIVRDDKLLTLTEVFDSLHLRAYDLSIDTLDVHAHTDSFHRFDKFNLKYNPIGESRLREIFLKTDNYIEGRYLAELTKEVISDLESSKYQMAEYRVSIYGRKKSEWDKLAKWVVKNKIFSHNVRWLIQTPRLYNIYKNNRTVENFEDVTRNIYEPLYEVTKDPSTHPELHVFLQRVVGFDSVDDESKAERRIHRKYPYPKDWNTNLNPPYSYYLYYMYSNLVSLNNWRRKRGFNTFVLRPHAGEAGDTDHLTSAFLTSQSISHGILLRKVPGLQYLYYIKQIGIAMSPLSNNALFLNYERNPFLNFFQKGLNISLSTDDPLQFHYTKEPLIEEYSVAAQIWKLSAVDMCELARNSVIQSGWEMSVKKYWLGANWFLPTPMGNDVSKTNVPNSRIAYRFNTLLEEIEMIKKYSNLNKDTSFERNTITKPFQSAAAAREDRMHAKSTNGWTTELKIIPGIGLFSETQDSKRRESK